MAESTYFSSHSIIWWNLEILTLYFFSVITMVHSSLSNPISTCNHNFAKERRRRRRGQNMIDKPNKIWKLNVVITTPSMCCSIAEFSKETGNYTPSMPFFFSLIAGKHVVFSSILLFKSVLENFYLVLTINQKLLKSPFPHNIESKS